LLCWDFLELLHHCARRAKSHGKAKERYLVGLLGEDKSVRDWLATEVDDLTKNTAAQTATVLGQKFSPISLATRSVNSLDVYEGAQRVLGSSQAWDRQARPAATCGLRPPPDPAQRYHSSASVLPTSHRAI